MFSCLKHFSQDPMMPRALRAPISWASCQVCHAVGFVLLEKRFSHKWERNIGAAVTDVTKSHPCGAERSHHSWAPLEMSILGNWVPRAEECKQVHFPAGRKPLHPMEILLLSTTHMGLLLVLPLSSCVIWRYLPGLGWFVRLVFVCLFIF